MQTQDIKQLLDRYYAGESSLDEERKLKAYFNSDKVSPELASHRSLFTGLKGLQEQTLSDDFEEKLLERLNSRPQARVLSLRTTLLRIAAAVVLILSVWLVIPETSGPQSGEINWTAYEVSEEQSVEEALAALRLLSEKLNNGKKTVKSEMTHMDRVVDPIQ